jgi:hypothetical protein
MATRKIPAREEVTCDVCGVLCDQHNRRQLGRFIVDCAGLDYQGMAVGNGGFSRDVCDKCLAVIVDVLEKACKKQAELFRQQQIERQGA